VRKVRIGVVGVGGMGQGHCAYMHELKEGELTAVCDVDRKTARMVGEKHGVPYFLKHTDLLDSGLVDAVLIATPHYHHPPIAIDAFKRGIHALSEKPSGVSVKDARAMVRAAERSGKVFSVMYQSRAVPAYQAAKKWLDSGGLGDLVRANAILAVYRSQAYYESAAWRATWKDEGGGVIVNQAPHRFDAFLWLAGMPKYVSGEIRTRIHDIETEDEAFALMEFPNGAHGYIYTSTTEWPGTTRFELAGDRGKLILDDAGLHIWELDPSIGKYTRKSKDMWRVPKPKQVNPRLAKRVTGHIAITSNFCRAILYGDELLVPGVEGIRQVELASAIILSSFTKKRVSLPLNAAAYEKLLTKLKARSKPKKTAKAQRITDVKIAKKSKKKTKKR